MIFEIERIADVVEFQTWGTKSPFSVSSLKEALETATGPDSDDEDIEDAEMKDELYVEAQKVFDELERRAGILGRAYPFVITGETLKPKQGDIERSCYIFCLGLTLLNAKHIDSSMRSPEFEIAVLGAAKSYFGGEGIRIGAPWKSPEFPEYVNVLLRIKELVAGLGDPLKTTAPGGGDNGWDILITKQFCDKKYPHLLILGNCATSKEEWISKGQEKASDHIWHTYFGFVPRNANLEFLALPLVISDDERSQKTYTKYLIFDRFRICEYAGQISDNVYSWLQENRRNACELPIS